MWQLLWAVHAVVVGHPTEIEYEGLHTPRQLRADRRWGEGRVTKPHQSIGCESNFAARDAVLVLDRDRLARDYRVECYNADLPRQDSEADELFYARDIVRLDRYLTHTVWLDAGGEFIGVAPHSPRPSARHREKQREESHGRRGRQLAIVSRLAVATGLQPGQMQMFISALTFHPFQNRKES